MKVKIDCPMCSLTELEEDICPNCETNLFLYRTLLELPAEDTVKKNSDQKWLSVSAIRMAILCVLMGIGLTTFVNSLLAGQKKPIVQNSMSVSEQTLDKTVLEQFPASPPASSKEQKATKESSQKSCGGLYYTVRRGNSLSLIASRFYGDSNSWTHIITTNPQLRGREDLLKIGEVLLIPNLDKYCRSEP